MEEIEYERERVGIGVNYLENALYQKKKQGRSFFLFF